MPATRSTTMKQLGQGLNLSTKKTRKTKFLDEMERVVPWAALGQSVEPHCPRAKTVRSPFPVEAMLRIHDLCRVPDDPTPVLRRDRAGFAAIISAPG